MPLRVRGYAAIFGNSDKEGEVIVKGAFSNWIDENPNTKVKLFWMHSHRFNPLAKPVGSTTMIREDAKGLYFEGQIDDTSEGLDLQKLISSGSVREASFGFKARDGFSEKGTVHFTQLDLLEITAANWGVNDLAFIEAIPGQQETNDE